jgi:biotin transport system permease protein
MLRYEPGDSLAHRLDPRTKLALQMGFATAVFTVTGPPALAVLAVVPAAALIATRLSPVAVLRAFWPLVLFLSVGPLFAAATLGPPWIDLEDGARSLFAVSRILLIVVLSAAYIRSTAARDSRAAVQRTVPGRPGQLLGVGVGLTIRFLPVLRRDIHSLWDAIRARGGRRRSIVHQVKLLARGGLRRSARRADRLSLALRARCFAWNPTLPALAFEPRDYPVLALALSLSLVPVARFAIGGS